MVNDSFTLRQQFVFGSLHTLWMGAVWERVERELSRRGKNVAWLAGEMGYTLQRVANWKPRGVPSHAHADIAKALGWTVDQLLGLEESSVTVPAALGDPPPQPWMYSMLSDAAKLAERMHRADALTREQLAPLLARLALRPEDAAKTIEVMARLLGATRRQATIPVQFDRRGRHEMP